MVVVFVRFSVEPHAVRYAFHVSRGSRNVSVFSVVILLIDSIHRLSYCIFFHSPSVALKPVHFLKMQQLACLIASSVIPGFVTDNILRVTNLFSGLRMEQYTQYVSTMLANTRIVTQYQHLLIAVDFTSGIRFIHIGNNKRFCFSRPEGEIHLAIGCQIYSPSR